MATALGPDGAEEKKGIALKSASGPSVIYPEFKKKFMRTIVNSIVSCDMNVNRTNQANHAKCGSLYGSWCPSEFANACNCGLVVV